MKKNGYGIKNIVALMFLLGTASSCLSEPDKTASASVSIESIRVTETAGGFSYVPPAGWTVGTGVPFSSLKYRGYIGDLDGGLKGAFIVQEVDSPKSLDASIQDDIAEYQKQTPAPNILSNTPFVTTSGLQGIKLVAELTQNDVLKRFVFYWFSGKGNQKIVIVAAWLASFGDKYEPVTDASMKTFALVAPEEAPESAYLSSWYSLSDTSLSSDAATPSTGKYDVNSLNAHFKVTPAQIVQAVSDATHDVEKNTGIDKCLDPYVRIPSGVRGSHGKSHESTVLLYQMDGAPFVAEAYNALHLYQKPNIPESWTKKGAYCRQITFSAKLMTLPKIGVTDFDSDRLADSDAVTVEKFILTDDANHAIQPITDGGVTDDGLVTASSTFTSTGNPNRSAYLPYYSEDYMVRFPLFDTATGKALIGTGCKKITLHIITQAGEQAVDYDLK